MAIQENNTQDLIPLEAFGTSCDPVLYIKKDVDKGELKDLLGLKLEYLEALTAAMNSGGCDSLGEAKRASYISALTHLTAECNELSRHI